MTDLQTRPDAGDASTGPVPATSGDGGDSATGPVEWAPAEPARKKRHLGLWIGIPAGVVVVGLVASSLLLIAPGTAVAGVGIGGMTQGAAAEAISARLADTTITLTGDGGDVTLTGADLGASVDAEALAEEAFAAHPAWKLGDWFADSAAAPVTIDPDVAADALRQAVPSLYVEPTDATVAFDAATASYTVVASVPGQGVDVDALQAELQSAFDAGSASVSVEPAVVPVEAGSTTEAAQASADGLNTMLDTVGFYIGDERTVPIDRATAASWLTLTPGDDGAIAVTADPAQIQTAVDGLAAAVDRAAVDATIITNSAGKALSDLTAGVNGRQLADTSGVADDFAAKLAQGEGQYQLSVTETAFRTTTLARRIDVNLSSQSVTLFENDAVVGSYIMSSGASGTATPTGNFAVNAHVRVQDMGALCYNPAAQNSYCTKDVPWVTYFAPDIAFHGASAFRSSLGFPQSHGCVNMWNGDAKFVYDWAVTGTGVSVHY